MDELEAEIERVVNAAPRTDYVRIPLHVAAKCRAALANEEALQRHAFTGDHSDLRLRFSTALGDLMSGDGGWIVHTQGHAHDMEAAITRIAALEGELKAAREALAKVNRPRWFYYGDDCSSDRCRDSIHECIDEDFSWDNDCNGDHVLLISGARPVPDIWVALHFYTDAEKDERDSDDEYIFTEHESEEAARAALSGERP